MINKILLASDNSSFSQSILTQLKHLNNKLSVEFVRVESIHDHTLQADEVFVFLNSAQQIPMELWNLHDNKSTSIVSSNPSTSISFQGEIIQNIAVQRHLIEDLDEKNLYLGELNGDVTASEPYIRESSFFIFNMDAVRASETLEPLICPPSGLFSEGATQMFRYAGMNELNKIVIINQISEQMLTLVAQFIWYYSEAAAIRFPDHPYFSNTVHEYVVQVESLGIPISFYKSKASGRWWIKVPDIPENKWKSCSYEDYNNACNDNLNSNLLEIISTVE